MRRWPHTLPVPARRHRAAFTLIELLIVIGLIALLIGILLTTVARARVAARSVNCLSTLRQIGVAFNQYAMDNRGFMPDPVASETPWERSLSRYLGNSTAFFICPADDELHPVIGSSYDWRDTGDPSTTLAGKKITQVNRGFIVLAFDALPGWHVRKKMNAVRLDGSAESMDQEPCLKDLMTPVR